LTRIVMQTPYMDKHLVACTDIQVTNHFVSFEIYQRRN
jgi:hypothetical protein